MARSSLTGMIFERLGLYDTAPARRVATWSAPPITIAATYHRLGGKRLAISKR